MIRQGMEDVRWECVWWGMGYVWDWEWEMCEMGDGRYVRWGMGNMRWGMGGVWALLLLLSWASGTLLVYQCWGLLALALAFAGVGIGVEVCWCWVGICWHCVCCHWHRQELWVVGAVGVGIGVRLIHHPSPTCHLLPIHCPSPIHHPSPICRPSLIHHLSPLIICCGCGVGWCYMVCQQRVSRGCCHVRPEPITALWVEAHRGGVGPRLCMWGADQGCAISIVENLKMIASKTWKTLNNLLVVPKWCLLSFGHFAFTHLQWC